MAKMNMKVGQAVFAILDLTIEMAAKQKAFHEVVISTIAADDENEKKQIFDLLKKQSDDNIDLYRTKILQYSEIDMNDLFNGDFEF